jgi:hypothetical protein
MVAAFESTTTKASPMSELTEDQILKKAKELCRRDGKGWSVDDFARKSGVTMFSVLADDSDREEYLSRARALLEEE